MRKWRKKRRKAREGGTDQGSRGPDPGAVP